MGESVKASSRSINPWVLHFQKLGLELKCPLWFASWASKEADSVTLRPHILQVEVGKSAVMDVDQVVQLLRGSPHSFGDVRGSENEIGGQGDTVENLQKYEPATLGKRSAVDVTMQENNEHSASGTDSKRLKKLEYGPINSCSNNVVSQAVGTCSRLSVVPDTCSQPLQMLSESSALKAVCGFCLSSRISEVTGPMLHYINGKPVEGDKATLSTVIHVHKICMEWTPRIYFVRETIKNLNAELARAAKLKCSRCGLKGAALGCFVKSCRRSYHVPCAMEINCRWDYNDYLVLCPAHSSHQFPTEKSSSEKHSLRHCSALTKLTPHQPNFWEGSSGVKEWVFCGSDLCPEEKGLLAEFGSMIGVPVTKFWKPNVTHVITSIDSDGACTRTLKVLMATLNGRWVLAINWIKACMQSMCPVDEEQYEVSLDNHGCVGGPRTGRLCALNNAPKLFDGLSFYFHGDFVSGYKEDLLNLVRTAGGVVLESEEKLLQHSHDQETPKTLIVYNLDPPDGCKLVEVLTIRQRISDAKDLAAKCGSQVVGHTWLLESIAAYKLQPFAS